MRRHLGVVVLLLAGCRAGDAPPSRAPAALSASAPRMLKVATDPGGLEGAGQDTFELAALRNLIVRLQTPTLPERVTWMTLRLMTPTGAAYQTRHIPYALQAGTMASPDGVAHSIDVIAATPTPGGYGLDVTIPAGGTNLQRRPQAGWWRVVADVDGHPELHAETGIRFELLR